MVMQGNRPELFAVQVVIIHVVFPQIQVLDINDNCPILTSIDLDLVTIPALQLAPVFYFSASDTDINDNGHITYITSKPVIE
jgi:hypothetical protein